MRCISLRWGQCSRVADSARPRCRLPSPLSTKISAQFLYDSQVNATSKPHRGQARYETSLVCLACLASPTPKKRMSSRRGASEPRHRDEPSSHEEDVVEAISDLFSRYSQRRAESGSGSSSRSPSRGGLSGSEVTRLESLWKATKKKLLSQSREIAQLQARAVREHAAKVNAANAQQEEAASQLSAARQVDALRDRSMFMEHQFAEVKGENERLRLSYNEALMKLGESLRVRAPRGATPLAAARDQCALRTRRFSRRRRPSTRRCRHSSRASRRA